MNSLILKPTLLAVALTLAASSIIPAHAADAPPALAAPTAPAWIATSNRHAQVLLQAQAKFSPEQASAIGLPGYDDKTSDLAPGYAARERAALSAARAQLQKALASERDPNVRQDLQIMIDTAARRIEGSELNERLLLNWNDVPDMVFGSMQDLLQEQSSPARRANALVRLNRYLGLAPGTESVFAQAKARFADSLADGKRLGFTLSRADAPAPRSNMTPPGATQSLH